MKKSIWAISALLALGFAFTACDGDDLIPDIDIDDCLNLCSGDTPYCVETYSGGHACAAVKSCTDEKVFNAEGLCVTNEVSGCESDDDCEEEGYICNLTTNVCEEGSEEEREDFSFVRVDDISAKYIKYEQDHSSGDKEVCFGKAKSDGTPDKTNCYKDPGADLDAIVLVKNGGDVKYATSVKEFARPADSIQWAEADITDAAVDDGLAADPRKVLGEPDAFVNYSDYYGGEYTDQCNLWQEVPGTNRTYVSLGGEGGYIIVQMGGIIEDGDKIDVLEVGSCVYRGQDGNVGTSKAQSEDIRVQVSTTSDTKTGWKLLGTSIADDNNKGILSFDVDSAKLEADDQVIE